MRSIKGEILRYRFLTDSEVSYLASTDPRFLRDPDEFCPTCGGEKSYKFRGTVYECDCQLQWQLWKHYSVSNIGSTYQRLDWVDYTSEERGPFETAILFRDNFKELISRGLGLLFGGGVGVGKTMLLSSPQGPGQVRCLLLLLDRNSTHRDLRQRLPRLR